MAMVFQSYALYPHMTVYENLASGLKLKKFQPQKSNGVAEVARVLGLEDLMNRKPGQMSGDNGSGCGRSPGASRSSVLVG